MFMLNKMGKKNYSFGFFSLKNKTVEMLLLSLESLEFCDATIKKDDSRALSASFSYITFFYLFLFLGVISSLC